LKYILFYQCSFSQCQVVDEGEETGEGEGEDADEVAAASEIVVSRVAGMDGGPPEDKAVAIASKSAKIEKLTGVLFNLKEWLSKPRPR